jgi:hypothetical protein
VDCGLRTADCGLRTADCGLRTADCGLRTADCRPAGYLPANWTAHQQAGYKPRDYRPAYSPKDCGLAIHWFLVGYLPTYRRIISYCTTDRRATDGTTINRLSLSEPVSSSGVKDARSANCHRGVSAQDLLACSAMEAFTHCIPRSSHWPRSLRSLHIVQQNEAAEPHDVYISHQTPTS